jgi:hypothetical protein
VPDADAGVASAMVNTGQQIGTSIGTALLNALAIGYMRSEDRLTTYNLVVINTSSRGTPLSRSALPTLSSMP